ncbi:cytochrome C, partial [Acidithiobacillus ferrooxidans]|nr:cytochrome C [Acidithiobacillus ferrooxidans]
FGYANDGRMQGVAPYVRLAYQRDWGNWNWEVGTYGMWSHLYDSPNTKGGPVDSFDDYDLDSQLQWLDTADNSNVTLHADWIHEDQTFGPGTTLSSSTTGNLNSLNINGSYWYHDHYGVSGG